MELKIKSVIVKSIRLWKSNYDDTEAAIKDLDSKYANYTHSKINAEILNINEEQLQKKLFDFDFSDTDTIFVEMPKNDDEYVFQPMSTEEEHEDF